MENEIKKYLESYDFLIFTLIFGSYASQTAGSKSDLDIGIYSNESLDLLLLGRMITDLEKITNLKIDLIELKDIYKKSPNLAYQIVKNHKLLFLKNEDVYFEFKRRSFLYYFDTEKLRESVRSALYKRISSKKFGKRNYA